MNDNTDRKVGACQRASANEKRDDLDPALLNEPERDSSDPARYAEAALLFEKLGNATVPIKVGTKRPAPNEWTTAKQATQERWKDQFPKSYTGVRTGQPFPLDDIDAPVGNALDVDIGIPKASAEIDLAWRRRYGDEPLRMGCWPRWLRQFRSPFTTDFIKGIALFGKFDPVSVTTIIDGTALTLSYGRLASVGLLSGASSYRAGFGLTYETT